MKNDKSLSESKEICEKGPWINKSNSIECIQFIYLICLVFSDTKQFKE
jgi:hypothetical protein